MTLPTDSIDVTTWPEWKRLLGQPITTAVYSAAVGLTNEEIEHLIKKALRSARRDLSS